MNTKDNKGEDAITAFHRSMLGTAEQLGKSDAARLEPKEGQPLAPYTGKLTKRYQERLADSVKPFLLNTDESDRQSLMEKKKRTEKKLEEATQDERTYNLDRDNLPTNNYQYKKTWPLYLTCWILSAGEGWFIVQAFAFRELTDNIYQVFLLMFFTVVFYIATKTAWGIYKRNEGMKHRNIVVAVVAIVFILTFYFIGQMRSDRLGKVSETTLDSVGAVHTPIPAYYYVSLSIFLMILGIYVTSQIPTDEEQGSNHEAKLLDKKIAQKRADINRYEAELDGIPDRLAAIEQRRMRQGIEADSIRLRLSAYHAECIAQYIATNRTYRADAAPSCFNDPIPDLI